MAHEVTGKIHVIGDAVQVSEKFTKREFVLTIADNPKYPQLVAFELTGDRCGAVDDFRVGDEVRVEFDLRGRKWTSPKGEIKFFNTLNVWRIDAVGARPPAGDPTPHDAPPAGFGPDLPF